MFERSEARYSPRNVALQMLARRARGSGGDSPTAQQVAYQYNKKKIEAKPRQKTSKQSNSPTKSANSPSIHYSSSYEFHSKS